MNVALIYGGRSGEHEVSLKSAKGVLTPLCNLGHTIYLIAISLEGRWYLQKTTTIQPVIETEHPLAVVPGKGVFSGSERLPLDAAFAVTHGYGGEDGKLQGLCMLANLPLCGCDTLSSALGMRKEISARLFALEEIPTVPSVLLDRGALQWLEGTLDSPPPWVPIHRERATNSFPRRNDRWSEACQIIQTTLGPSLFIKPEEGGSSLGVAALRHPEGESFRRAVQEARKQSATVLVQTLIEPMDELECALFEIEEGELVVAGPALVVDPGKKNNHFLSYQYKYSQVDSAYLCIPSTYSHTIEEQIRLYAKKAFKAIGAEGYARIDFFVSGERIYLNEINTSPGMTEKSHYPLLMSHAGYSMEEVLSSLIKQALEKKREEKTRCYRPPEA